MDNQKDAKRTGDKLKFSRLVSNVRFILGYAYEIDKTAVISLYTGYIIIAIIFSLYSSLFLKYFIEMLQNREVALAPVLLYAAIGCVIKIIGEMIEGVIDTWTKYRFVRVTGVLQRKLIEKAAKIDLMCYDNKEYFDDFVIAASQSEETMYQAIYSTAAIFSQAVSVFLLGGIIFTINPLIAVFPIAGALINFVTRIKITQLEYNYDMEYKRIMRKADYSKRVFYQPEYAKEIKLSNIRVPLNRQFNEAVEETMGKAKAIGKKIAILSLIEWISVFTVLMFFCPPLYLGYLALVKKSIGLGDVVALRNAQNNVVNTLDGFNYAIVYFQRAGQFIERFRRFIDYEIHIEEHQGNKIIPAGKHVLEVRDMSFRYDGSEQDTLSHINMTIQPGEKVAFVGENGAGKTTFVKLLMRLYDVTEGSIIYGGEDIRNYSTKDYRNIIGAVFQDYQLYGATLAENVAMNQIKDENTEHITKALHLADFGNKLERLPKGLKTNMTREFEEDGTMLSGGETQKVAISRMFAKSNDLSIAILDEPSSALDPLAEYKLNKNMMQQTKDATVIFISHRLSTTKDADCIYMFENGRIVEHGTHDELMSSKGAYAFMFEKQAHYYQDEINKHAFMRLRY